MTTETRPAKSPRKRSKLITPLHIIEALIIVGLLAWHFGFFTHTPKIAIITSGEGHYWDLVEAGAKKAADQYDVKVEMIRVKTDYAAQTEAIRQALTQKYDGLAISPINPMSQAGILAEAASASSLVTLDSDSPVARRLCFVGTDNYDAGRMCGQLVRDAIPEGGEVIISIGNLEKQNTQSRRQGVIDQLLDRSYNADRESDPVETPLKGDRYTIVTTLADGADHAVATDLAAKAIKEHPNVKCFIGLLSYTAPCIVKALEQTNQVGKIKIVGFDAADETLAGIESGQIAGTVMQDQFGCGYHAVRLLGEYARGDHSQMPVFDRQTLPCDIVTKENLDTIRQRLSLAPSTQPQ
jgi:ribose transport system substrate-binding protein